MKIIIVTGKSGSGKSEVASMLSKELSCSILFLDDISHLSLKNAKIKNMLKEKFGDQIFEGNNIDRKKLGQIIFNSPEDLEFVNNLSWKFIDEFVDKKLKNLKSEFIILDYALLPKMKYFKQATVKILVVARKDVRLNRLCIRDNANYEYLNLRDAHSLAYKKSEYDFVVDNSKLSKLGLATEIKNIAKKIQI